MRDLYLLTVAYKIDRFSKYEDAIRAIFMWTPIFPSEPYDISDGKIYGQPIQVYLAPKTSSVLLYVAKRVPASSDKNSKPVIPPKIIKAFEIVVNTSQIEVELELQFYSESPDNELRVKVLNKDAEIEEVLNKKNPKVSPELPIVLPSIPRARFEPMEFLWIIDGTLSEVSFQKCINIATLFSEELFRKTELVTSYYCFGEYAKLFTFNHSPIPYGAYSLIVGAVSRSSVEFKKRLRSHQNVPPLPRDDPAAAMELALKKLADDLESGEKTNTNPLWVFVMGDSLPHFTIEDIHRRGINIIPTEEFENINWHDCIQRIVKYQNVHIQPIWFEDNHRTHKWAEADNFVSPGLNEAKHWWKKELGKYNQCIEVTDDSTPSAISSLLMDAVWQYYPPRFVLDETSIYPLWQSLSELRIYS